MKNHMIKPNLKLVNFNIDYKLPKKEVTYNGDQIMLYGRIADIDKRFPNGKEKIVEPTEGTADPSADIPVFGGPLIPISLSAAVGKATTNLKAVASVALSSVGAMKSGLDSLALGSADELVALAKLDKVILEAKAELGQISAGNKDKLSMGLETDILKAQGIKTPGALGDALSMGDPSGALGTFAGIDGDMMAGVKSAATGGLKLPSVSKLVDSAGGLSLAGVDKSLGFRDIIENVDVKITSIADKFGVSLPTSVSETIESFAKAPRVTRVYGSETNLNNKFGVDDFADVAKRRGVVEAPRPSAITSISKKIFTNGKWLDTGAA